MLLLLAVAVAVQVRAEPYKGWSEAVILDAPEARARVVVATQAGGRIVSYGLGGENVIFENPDYLGKTLENAKPETLAQGYLGYNVDLGPELRGIPRHLALWMGKHAWTSTGPAAVRLESAHDPAVGMTIVKELALDPKTGVLDVNQVMKNTSDREQSYCFWDRTLCSGGGFAIVPLSKSSRKPGGWGCISGKKYDKPEHPNVRVIDGVLVAKAEGKAGKLGADPDEGWIAYAKGRQMIVKYYPVFPEGKYTDDGNTVELYWDAKVCELEPLSPEVALKPGEAYSFPERWILLPLEKEPSTHQEARALVERIPANPFKR